ncbi:MAG: hypothetical protein A3F80_05890 [Candidatus Melainabacteria bacterium RIFCSPLOWO2_12_FULL_35_11]|nr:MAG: hypothetical protein A3F80_05890 [Candidatus Melainabacteria bacterium RIFCSPLOWO2_12_FULL_35_11]
MKLLKADDSKGDSVSIMFTPLDNKYSMGLFPFNSKYLTGFICSKCNNQIAMITNPQETQMVRTLELNIGGTAIPDKPVKEGLLEEPETSKPRKTFGLLRGKDDGVRWTKEAEERLKRVPPFVQPMARQSIVNYAKEKGVREITLQVMDEVREKVGM